MIQSTTQYDPVLQGTTQYYSVFHSITRYYSVLQSTTLYYPVLLRTTQNYSVLYRTTSCYTVLQCTTPHHKRTTTYFSVLQSTSMHYSVLQSTTKTTKYQTVPRSKTPYYTVVISLILLAYEASIYLLCFYYKFELQSGKTKKLKLCLFVERQEFQIYENSKIRNVFNFFGFLYFHVS